MAGLKTRTIYELNKNAVKRREVQNIQIFQIFKITAWIFLAYLTVLIIRSND